MARVNITFDLNDGESFEDALAVFGRQVQDQAWSGRAEAEQEPDAGARQDAEPGERSAVGTKFRRSRDEIARGLTIEQAMAERAQAAAPQPEPQVVAPSTASTADGPVADPFAEPPKPASPPTSDASTGTTQPSLDAVKAAMSAWLGRDGNEAEKMKPIFARFKTAEGDVAQRASQLVPGDYAAFIEALAA